MKRAKTYYYAMLVALCLRLFWAVVFEPHGMQRVMAAFPDHPVSLSLRPVVYTQIPLLTALIVLSVLKKPAWIFKLNLVVGCILTAMIIYMPITGLNQGIGPAFVIPFSLGIALFSLLTIRHADQLGEA
ncbi:MAG: hypothetical protein D6E12_07670 [Desulfovibrio sp.]|nr:MAG: hypothetical protein D6E12_07670 [Desulfovibrio sp.]